MTTFVGGQPLILFKNSKHFGSQSSQSSQKVVLIVVKVVGSHGSQSSHYIIKQDLIIMYEVIDEMKELFKLGYDIDTALKILHISALHEVSTYLIEVRTSLDSLND